MCGIVGIVKPGETQEVTEPEISRMLGMIRHRGPDQFGMYFDRNVGLGSARLSIIDLSSGQQPICNETQDLWIVFNGEIFNYVELKPDLEAKGHRFTTTSDTEVLLHLYEEYGPECLNKLNGQFAFAVWDARKKSLFMARDRLGVRPLFYTVQQGKIVFASEIKAILANDFVSAAINPTVLRQVFTYWSALSPQTIFQGVFELPPGHYLIANTDSSNSIRIQRYWRLNFPKSEPSSGCARPGYNVEECEEKLGELLIDAAKLRLRADVPVGAYLSGGLDSSIIASIIRNFTTNKLDTFSIAFDDVNFDESSFQRKMASFLGTKHHVVVARHSDIGRVFPDVVWHTETPLMRTSPAPMFILSQLVRDAGYKVVLTGEGADEFLGGYDIFKEAKIRRFWARCPDSTLRPLLLKHLYPDIAELAKSGETFRRAFFKADLLDVDDPSYSHALRWRNGARNCRFFSTRVRAAADSSQDAFASQLDPDLLSWEPLARAQFLEIKLFFSQYLLSSQGDRVAMAHSVEGRFPFLDHRMVEFCNSLPANLKLKGMKEKYLLKRLGRRWLPAEIWQRRKRPYRAPIHRSFFNNPNLGYIDDLLSPSSLGKSDLFDPVPVGHLIAKVRQRGFVGENDDMAIAGIVSAQLLHQQFISQFRKSTPVSASDNLKVCRQAP